MLPSMPRGHLTLFTLLLVSMGSGDTVKMNMERRFADSLNPGALGSSLVEYPYWEHILREFLFKTISPPPPSNNILYKEILEAPLYIGPFPASEILNNDDGHETVQVLSRGDVYHLAEGGWIICQEGCLDCEICTVQKTAIVPTVKWILRRIERLVPFAQPKRHDLQLTVSPQADGSFHMKNLSPDSYVYVTSNNGVLASFTDTLIRGNEKYSLHYPFGTTKSPTTNTPRDLLSSSEDEGEGLDQEKVETGHWTKGPETENEVLQMTSTLTPKVERFPTRKRGREVLRGERNPVAGNSKLDPQPEHSEKNSTPMTMFYPPTTPMVKSIDYDFGRERDARLILGRDQFGEKHLVHVVPAGEMDQEMKRASMYSDSQLPHQQPANLDPVHTELRDHPLYRKIFRRVIDSLNTHKSAIEKFLFSPKREVRLGHGKFLASPSETIHKEEENNLKNDENSPVGTLSAEEDAESKETIRMTGNVGEIIKYSEETSSNLPTATDVLDEEGEVSLESHLGIVDVTEDQSQESNHQILDEYFDEENFDKSFSDELIEQQNNSQTLILKEVAKSIVYHPEGFNSLTDTTNLHREPDGSLATNSEGTATESVLHSDRREKSRRNVLHKY